MLKSNGNCSSLIAARADFSSSKERKGGEQKSARACLPKVRPNRLFNEEVKCAQTNASPGSPLTDLVIKQTCRQLSMDVDTCKNDERADEEAHRTSSTIIQWRIVIETLPGCIMSLFTSPWSEKNGRKPILIVSVLGVTLTQAILTYMCTIEEINPYWYLVAGIPSSISGGLILIVLCSYCYIIDVTEPNDRVMRFTIIGEFAAITAIVANLVTPILDKIGYLAVFGVNTAVSLAVLVYVIFLLPESIQVKPEEKDSLFKTDHLVDSFTTFFKKRPNNVRSAVFGLTSCAVLNILITSGEPDCKYLAVMKTFNWTLTDYSTYNAVYQGLQAVGTLSGAFVLMNIFGAGEGTATIILQIVILTSSILTAASNSPVMFYITSQLRMFSGCIMPLIKGYISKLVPQHDVAKVLAFGSSLEAFMPQTGAFLYAQVYNMTVSTYPFSIFLLSFLLQLLATIFALIGLTMEHFGRRNTKTRSDTDEETGGGKETKNVEKSQLNE